MQKEAFYLAGALRDGSISTQYQIKVKQKSKKWLEEIIIPAMNKTFNLNLSKKAIYTQDEDGNVRYYLLFKNKRAWNILRNKFEMPHNQSYWETPCFVKQAKPQMLKHYIQGFCDAEGGVVSKRKVMAGSKIYLNFTQKNEETLEFIKKALMNFRIKTGSIVVSDKKSKSLRIWITEKRSILRFIQEIGTKHPDKMIAFNHIRKVLL